MHAYKSIFWSIQIIVFRLLINPVPLDHLMRFIRYGFLLCSFSFSSGIWIRSVFIEYLPEYLLNLIETRLLSTITPMRHHRSATALMNVSGESAKRPLTKLLVSILIAVENAFRSAIDIYHQYTIQITVQSKTFNHLNCSVSLLQTPFSCSIHWHTHTKYPNIPVRVSWSTITVRMCFQEMRHLSSCRVSAGIGNISDEIHPEYAKQCDIANTRIGLRFTLLEIPIKLPHFAFQWEHPNNVHIFVRFITKIIISCIYWDWANW